MGEEGSTTSSEAALPQVPATAAAQDLPGATEGAPGAMLVIISGPAGVGKDTILKELKLLPSAAQREFVVTFKSREPRWDEVDGIHYHFVSPERFHEIHRAGGLLEAAAVHGQ